MKTTSWIKLIGILCIVFGAIGLLDDVSMLLLRMAHLPEAQGGGAATAMQQQSDLITYGSIPVQVLYLVAGMFFLLRKSFSLRLMFFALVVSFLFGLLPTLILSGYAGKLFLNIFALIGPGIDAALLIGVYSIRKYYYDAPETVVYFLGSGRLSQGQLKTVSLAGFVCMLIPLTFFGLWLAIPKQGLTHVEVSNLYNSYFPEFLHGRFVINYLGLALCPVAVLLGSIGLRVSGSEWRMLNIVGIVLAVLLLMVNLFSLM